MHSFLKRFIILMKGKLWLLDVLHIKIIMTLLLASINILKVSYVKKSKEIKGWYIVQNIYKCLKLSLLLRVSLQTFSSESVFNFLLKMLQSLKILEKLQNDTHLIVENQWLTSLLNLNATLSFLSKLMKKLCAVIKTIKSSIIRLK